MNNKDHYNSSVLVQLKPLVKLHILKKSMLAGACLFQLEMDISTKITFEWSAFC